MSSDKHVHSANGSAGLFQSCADVAISKGCFFVKGGDIQGDNELIKGFGVFLPMLALGNSITQFGKGNGRNAYVADLIFQKMLEHGRWLLFDNVNTNIVSSISF